MFKKNFEYYSFFSKLNWHLRYQFIKRLLGLQMEDERELELLLIESKKNILFIEKTFSIDGLWRHAITWWKYGFLYSVGLHKSLIESIRDGLYNPNDYRTSVELLEECRYERFDVYDDFNK
jgi:hypothetical protein